MERQSRTAEKNEKKHKDMIKKVRVVTVWAHASVCWMLTSVITSMIPIPTVPAKGKSRGRQDSRRVGDP